MVSNKKAIDCIKVLVEFCQQQGYCQNCILRINKCDHWECNLDLMDAKYDIAELEAMAKAKTKKGGWL